MALALGKKLGPYEIQSPLGAGGMGEVYRARDIRLERSVAVKVLPAHLSDRPEAGERFEREARTISSLNHPNICHLHDVGEQDGVRYLVMELLEGETLADRLRRGPMPLDQVLRYGAEIAEGLDAAHRRGVVHRDLKPGNVMLTKTGARLMDFGLAKEISTVKPVSAELTATMTSSHATPLTQQGTIVGTFQYMAPEQIEGKEADARSDIFSLGAVLYEMIGGKRAFEGRTLVSVAAAILEKEPALIRTLQPATPSALERAIKKCLAKDPDARWQSAGDLASELKWIAEGGAAADVQTASPDAARKSLFFAWALAGVALVAAIALAFFHFGAREAKPLVRTQIASSDKWDFNFVGDNAGPPVISPDGTHIVFSAHAQGKQQLFLRSMDNLTPQPIPGTDDATFPFWSPDSGSIGFFADAKLKRMDIGGGPATIICDAPIGRGASWGPNGTIVFSPQFSSPIYQVSATGGTSAPITKLTDKYTTHRWPAFLPDGKHFVYLAANHAAPTVGDTAVFWASLDGKQNKLVVSTPSSAVYASGYLLFVRQNALMAQRFDPSSGELEGQASVLNDDVQVDSSVWRGTFSASDNGTMVYQPGMAGGAMQLTWFDNHGREIGHLGEPDDYYQVELSPDGNKAAAAIGSFSYVIWVYDLKQNTRTRLTFGPSVYVSPIWSHDGKQIAYMRGGVSTQQALLVKAADGSGEEKKLLDTGAYQGLQSGLCDWSPDGRYILYIAGTASVGNGTDIWALPLFGDRKPFAYIAAPGNQLYAQFSPDGRWVAYSSDESGTLEVYVAPFPWTGAKWQVSNGGGVLPRWRRDGKQIFFLRMGSASTFGADVDGDGSSFEVGAVHTLYNVNNLSPNTAGQQYSVTGDGQRFLQITTGDTGKGRRPLNVIQNWTLQLQGK
jgi:Tol biopolymer transport system component/tRNA A-37 threonylcarbamoyl transferase component Bud32